jgi:Flp pilus assembly protein TadD
VSEYPDDWFARAQRVVCLITTGEFDEGLKEARKAVELNPKASETRGALLQALDANGMLDELRDEAARQVNEYPSDFYPWEAKGRVAWLDEDYDEAERCFRKAVGIRPNSNFAWMHIALICLRGGRYEEALQAFGQAHVSAHDRAGPPDLFRYEALVGQCMCLLYLELPSRVLVLAEQIERLNVDVAHARALQARCKFSLGHADAASVAESALRLGFRDGYLMMALANFHAESGNLKEAKRILDTEKAGPDTYARNIRAAALARVGLEEEAVRELDSLKGAIPEYVRLNSLAAVYMVSDKPREALDALREALKHKEDHVILTNAGILCMDLSYHAKSNEDAQRLRRGAEGYLKRALDKEPNSPSAVYNLGVCYAAQGKESMARSRLRKLANSGQYDSNLRSAATELLARMEQGQEISDWMKTEDLKLIPRTQ